MSRPSFDIFNKAAYLLSKRGEDPENSEIYDELSRSLDDLTAACSPFYQKRYQLREQIFLVRQEASRARQEISAIMGCPQSGREIHQSPTEISFGEFQKEVLRTEHTPLFLDKDGGPDSPGLEARRLERLLHGAIGVCTEGGELQDALKKHMMHGKQLDYGNVMEECFDILWYVTLCLDAAGFTLDQAVTRGIAKLRVRYPNGFTKKASEERDLSGERLALKVDCKDQTKKD